MKTYSYTKALMNNRKNYKKARFKRAYTRHLHTTSVKHRCPPSQYLCRIFCLG